MKMGGGKCIILIISNNWNVIVINLYINLYKIYWENIKSLVFIDFLWVFLLHILSIFITLFLSLGNAKSIIWHQFTNSFRFSAFSGFDEDFIGLWAVTHYILLFDFTFTAILQLIYHFNVHFVMGMSSWYMST